MDIAEIIRLLFFTSPVWIIPLVWLCCRLSSSNSVPTSREHLLYGNHDLNGSRCRETIPFMFRMGKGTATLNCLYNLFESEYNRPKREKIISKMSIEDCDELLAALRSVYEFHENEEHKYYSPTLKKVV